MNSRSTKTLSSKDERILNALGTELLSTSAQANASRVQALLNGHAPAWFQDQTTGWGALHFAIAGDGRGNKRKKEDVLKCVELLLEAGAPWNAGKLNMFDSRCNLIIRRSG
jgi:hypothetical protein